MAARGKHRGHPMHFDESRNQWIYDDGQPVPSDPDRPCGHCGLANTPEGHDGCLGTLPGVMNACCGHGATEDAYIQFPDGTSIHGEEAVCRTHELGRRSPEQDGGPL